MKNLNKKLSIIITSFLIAIFGIEITKSEAICIKCDTEDLDGYCELQQDTGNFFCLQSGSGEPDCQLEIITCNC